MSQLTHYGALSCTVNGNNAEANINVYDGDVAILDFPTFPGASLTSDLGLLVDFAKGTSVDFKTPRQGNIAFELAAIDGTIRANVFYTKKDTTKPKTKMLRGRGRNARETMDYPTSWFRRETDIEFTRSALLQALTGSLVAVE